MVIEVSKGAGHATFLSMRDVATDTSADYKSQAHTSDVSLDMQYFYSAASHDGVFYRINLDTWVVDKTLPVDANLLMGSFIWDGDGGRM